jgi:hypothetical protein
MSSLSPFATRGASSAISARSAAGHVYCFLILLLLTMRAAYPLRVPIKRVDSAAPGPRPASRTTGDSRTRAANGSLRQRPTAKKPRHRRDCRRKRFCDDRRHGIPETGHGADGRG